MSIQFDGGAVMNRRRFLRSLALIAAAALSARLFGCRPDRPLVVAILPWVGYQPLYLARDLKWLPDRVRLRDGRTTNDSITALRSGQADAACITLDEMLRARAAGIPLAAALVFDVSAGADMVLARPGIATLYDLARKRLGFDQHATSSLVFQKVLETTGLPASAFTLLDLPPARQLAAWRRNEVDAVITFEPTATLLMHEGARSLFDSRLMPDTIIDVLAVRRDRPAIVPLVRALAACHFRALEHMRSSEQDTLYRIAAREGITPEEARRELAGVTLPSLAVNRAYLVGGDARLIRAARRLSALMVRCGMLAREDDLKKLILPNILPGDER